MTTQLDRIESKIDKLNSRLGAMENGHAVLNERANGGFERLAKVEAEKSRIEKQVQGQARQVASLKQKLAGMAAAVGLLLATVVGWAVALIVRGPQ